MKVVIRWSLIALLFGWLFWNVDFDKLYIYLLQIKPIGVVLTFFVGFFSDLLISYRWYYLSRFHYSYISCLEATMVAFVLNYIAPAKLGDLSKIYYLHKKEGCDPYHSTSLFFIERFFDVLVLGGMILLTALFILPSTTSLVTAIILLLLVALFFYTLFNRRFATRLLLLIPFDKLRRMTYKVLVQIRSNLSPKRIFATFVITLFIWISYYINNIVFFLTATDFDLTVTQIIIASTIAFAVSAIPITPGGIGTFQAAFILSLGWYGVSKEQALAASVVLQILYILPASLYSLYLVLFKDLRRDHVSAL